MITIKLTKGFSAVIDDEDAEIASQRWCALLRPDGSAYAVRSEGPAGKQRFVYMHRRVAGRMGLALAGMQVDHRDGDKLMNRRFNLRAVEPTENLRNIACTKRKDGSGYLGVSLHSGGKYWIAQMRRPGKTPYLGSFKTEQEALICRLKAEREWGVAPRRVAFHAQHAHLLEASQ